MTNGPWTNAMRSAHRKPGARRTLFVWKNARTFAICALKELVKTNCPKRDAKRSAMPKSARRTRNVRRTVRKLVIYAMIVFLHHSTNCLDYKPNK